jgi:hypothetical protein
MTALDFVASEPTFKPEGKYLHPRSWVDPIPAEDWTPDAQGYGVAATCWYVRVAGGDGWRKVFAARTPETALASARGWMEQQVP